MKKMILALAVIAGLVVAASYDLRIEVRPHTAHACQGSGC
jgi:hypothetical protein